MRELVAHHEFWVAVAFVIVAAVLAWKGSPVIARMLDEHAAKIRGELEEAQRLREEAQRTLAEYQRKQRDALKEAEQIVALAAAEAERAAGHAARELEAAVKRRQGLALEKIALAESKALAEVRNTAVDVAISAVRRMMAEDLDAQRKAKLVDDAIAELPQRLN